MNIHITLLGKATLPVYYPIIKLEQDIIHVICTKENVEIAQQFEKVLIAKGKLVEKHVVNAFKPIDVLKVCENIHSLANKDDVFLYNITGGNKIMAFAAYSVAQKHKAKIIYNNTTSIIDMTSFEEIEITSVLATEDIFLLQGQILKEYVQSDRIGNKEVDCAEKIKQFVVKYNKEYGKIQNAYLRLYNKKMPNSYNHLGLEFFKTENRVVIKNNNQVLLEVDHEQVLGLLFEGRWWEVLVVDSINQWNNGRYEVWSSVKFKPKKTFVNNIDIDKNEIDVLVNIGNVLLFIECKSGNVTQDNVYKSKIVRDTYGGDKSKAIIVSFYPINDQNVEKAKESEINVFAPKHYKGGSELLTHLGVFLDGMISQLNL